MSMREGGFEPPQVLPHKILSLARLPVPPLSRERQPARLTAIPKACNAFAARSVSHAMLGRYRIDTTTPQPACNWPWLWPRTARANSSTVPVCTLIPRGQASLKPINAGPRCRTEGMVVGELSDLEPLPEDEHADARGSAVFSDASPAHLGRARPRSPTAIAPRTCRSGSLHRFRIRA
jgi:hypothetical protein